MEGNAVLKRICFAGVAVMAATGGHSQASDAQKMGIPVIRVPNAPRVCKLVRGGTSSDLQNGTMLVSGDAIDNYGGSDVDLWIENLGLIRVKQKSYVRILTAPKPNAKLNLILEKGSMMCWAKFNPTQYKFMASSGQVDVSLNGAGDGTSFMMTTTRQPLKQPNYVTVLCGQGSVKVFQPDPESSAWVLAGQIIKVDPRLAVGQAGKPHPYEASFLRELRQSPY